jgi:glutathione-independent formaldehyde dehydrogenase
VRAVVYQGTRDVGVHTVADAVLEDPEDVVLEVTSSAICGTDLHMYDGRTGAEPGLVLGHEPVGVVREIGADVHLVRPGQRVVIPTHLFCGVCYNAGTPPNRPGSSRPTRSRCSGPVRWACWPRTRP